MNSKKQQEQIDWRRAKVLEMMSKGENNQSEIARILSVDKSVISKDVAVIREQSRHLDEAMKALQADDTAGGDTCTACPR